MLKWLKRTLGLGGRGDFFDQGGILQPGRLEEIIPDDPIAQRLFQDQINFIRSRIDNLTRDVLVTVCRKGPARYDGRIDMDIHVLGDPYPYATISFVAHWPFDEDRFALEYYPRYGFYKTVPYPTPTENQQ